MGPAGLARWESELANLERGKAIADEAIARMRAHRCFGDAVRHTVVKGLAAGAADKMMAANFRDMGRMVLGMIALYLDATGGLTHTRLRALSGESGAMSAGRATAILLRLRVIGYVSAAEERSDGSARLYVPTEKMKAAFRNRIRIELESIALMEPEMTALLARFEQEEALRLFVGSAGKVLVSMPQRPGHGLDAFNALTGRNAGMQVVFALFEATDTGGEFPASGPARLSVAGLARRFGASRTNILRILRQAERDGYVVRGTHDDVVTVLPNLRDAFALHYAIVHITLAGVAQRTLAALTATSTRAEAALSAAVHASPP